MKVKSKKLFRLISAVLCCMLLLNMGAALALTGDGAVPMADEAETDRYGKITSADDLKVGATYVIVYHDEATDKRYALSTDASIDFTKEVKLANSDVLMVDPDGDYVFTVKEKNDEGKFKLYNGSNNIRLNGTDGIFSSSTANLELICDAESGLWSINNTSARALTFSSGKFGMTTGKTDSPAVIFELWAIAETTKLVKLPYLEMISTLPTDSEFVIVMKSPVDGKSYAIGNGSSGNTAGGAQWLYDIERSAEGNVEYITVKNSDPVIFNAFRATTTGKHNGVPFWGFDKYGIKLKNGNFYYPQSVSNTRAPFRSQSNEVKDSNNNEVRFEYGVDKDGETVIYIRGNSAGGSEIKNEAGIVTGYTKGSYLGYGVVGADEDGKEIVGFTGTLMQEDEGKVPVEIYVAIPNESKTTKVEFINEKGEVGNIAYANGEVLLPNNVPDTYYEKDGVKYPYTFVGWTKKALTQEERFLSLEDSCNIYDYDSVTKVSHIVDRLGDANGAYAVIGDCNPDKFDTKLGDLVAGETLTLYPVYAVRGFDSVATADDDGTPIVGVSDWKADPAQGLDAYYDNAAREKWLGYITVQVYKDGVEWGDPSKVYYRYHDDNTADLSIKFIWSNIVNEMPELDDYKEEFEKYKELTGEDLNPLHVYMSDHSLYPKYDQSGHYIIDAVIATQGGSQDGMLNRLNWMTSYGGKLDNVDGNSTVHLFVTTKYNAKYYLDNEEIEDYFKADEFFTTPGTEERFSAIEAALEGTAPEGDFHKVRPQELWEEGSDEEENKRLLALLEQQDITDDSQYIIVEDDESNRGIPEVFTYLIKLYDHSIFLEDEPEVAEGKILVSTGWTMKDAEMNPLEVYDSKSTGKYADDFEYDWTYKYELKGTQQGTDKTTEGAYIDGDNGIAGYANALANYTYEMYKSGEYESINMPYIFHLYAYTTGLKISKTVTGDAGEKDRAFTFTLTLGDTGVNGRYGDLVFENGVATFTLKDGESVLALGLPAGMTFTVAEKDADGYTVTMNGEEIASLEGEIQETGETVVAVGNHKSDPKPEPKPEPDPAPETGDSSVLALVLMMITSIVIIIAAIRKRKQNMM